eukprot:scaffold302404_cov47-Prasinocladus_malaysianus.AAC.3
MMRGDVHNTPDSGSMMGMQPPLGGSRPDTFLLQGSGPRPMNPRPMTSVYQQGPGRFGGATQPKIA